MPATILALLLPSLAAANQPVPAGTAPRPVVVELFTSQGCSSCPPADALLGELARRKDLVALSFHVDYWDYIGWRDPYASPATTERQRDYARSLGLRMVYTPQMVVGGRADAAGSDRAAVARLIDEAARQPQIEVGFSKDESGRFYVELPAQPRFDGMATVWLAVFDHEHETPVARGENAGATLDSYNVVREWRRLGSWSGGAQEIPMPMAPDAAAKHDGCAVIVQRGEAGAVLGAAILPMRDGSW
ncbi:MAG: DUF1223 domain-containing protein [Dongiaceae bacterium]